jgi:uncharacterized membrane protein YphA (DoxX/SURF4 family)
MLRLRCSTFPSGWAGFGLLLLRVTAGGALAWYAYFMNYESWRITTVAVATLALASGIGLLSGYFTTLASVVAALVSTGLTLPLLSLSSPNVSSTRVASGFTTVIAIAICCMGPGAFSIDGRRYGRREIIVPRRPKPEE